MVVYVWTPNSLAFIYKSILYLSTVLIFINYDTTNCKPSNFVIIFNCFFSLMHPCISIFILVSACSFLDRMSWDSDRDCLKSVDTFVENFIFTILTIPNHKHRTCLHLLRSSSVFLSNVLNFLVYKYFNSLVYFISKYFWYYCEWNCLLTFIFRLLFASDKRVIEFCTLTLCPVTLLKWKVWCVETIEYYSDLKRRKSCLVNNMDGWIGRIL